MICKNDSRERDGTRCKELYRNQKKTVVGTSKPDCVRGKVNGGDFSDFKGLRVNGRRLDIFFFREPVARAVKSWGEFRKRG